MAFQEWPTPAPLAGVKSRKRAIFEVLDGAQLDVNGEVLEVSDIVRLTLGSRVCAHCQAGHALTGLLLGHGELARGRAFRNEGLAVVHLGPHLLRGCGGGAARAAGAVGRYGAAVAAALEGRPHVVVLDEARESGDKAWAHAFRQLLCGEALRSFRGAVVVRAEVETPAVQRACAEHWAVVGERLWQLEMAAVDLEVMSNDPEMEGGLDAVEEAVPEVLDCALQLIEVGGA